VNKPTVIANVHREEDWWVIDLPGIGVTQAARAEDIEHMARDLVESLTGSRDVNVRVQKPAEETP
jgi:hypothetical protein